MKPVRVGCSGWNYQDWRGRLYPEGVGTARWLGLYAESFDTVEINSTFYRLPRVTPPGAGSSRPPSSPPTGRWSVCTTAGVGAGATTPTQS